MVQIAYSKMTTLNQRILIPAAPQTVWDFVSDINNNPRWQADCQSVSFLTTFHAGQGTRWRYSTEDQHEYVVEITAWYDGLGYEYVIVDGTPFKSNKGRIRLQEIAEGTIVEWSFTYELGGPFAGMRNSLGVKRGVDNLLVDSLRALWKQIGQGEHKPKMLMRDAPDVEARAAYKPRHATAFSGDDQVEVNPPDSSRFAPPPDYVPSFITEPPLVEEDTRPNPTAVETTSAPANDELEPEFLASISPFDAPTQAELNAAETATIAHEQFQPIKTEPAAVSPVTATQETVETSEKSKIDTAKISVFEIFGIPKPSETQEMRAVLEELTQKMDSTEPHVEQVAEAANEAAPSDQTEAPREALEPSQLTPFDTSTRLSTFERPTLQPTVEVEAPKQADELIQRQPASVPSTGETQSTHTVTAVSETPPTAVHTSKAGVEKITVTGGRVGLRIVQRRKLIRLKRPK